jgi:hypothetical protein
MPKDISHEQRAHFGGVHNEYFGFLFEEATPMPLMPCQGNCDLCVSGLTVLSG